MPTDDNRKPFIVYPALLLGLLGIALSAIFIRYAQGEALPSLFIAAGRLILAALILTPFTLRSHRADLAALSRRDLLLAAAAGIILALHFITWIASLGYTSVLVSVVLVTTSPLWVALIEYLFLRVHLRRAVIGGLLIAFLGGLLIGAGGGSEVSAGSSPVLGGALALAGAVAFACYLVLGRNLRAKLPLLPYIWLVYGFAAIFLLILVIVTATPVTGYSTTGYLMIALLAIFPQLIGHSSFNFVLRYLSATYVSIVSQIDPILSAIAAYFAFGEVPLPLQVVGSAAILIGVVVATLAQDKPADKVEVIAAAEDT